MPVKGLFTPSEVDRVKAIVSYIEDHCTEKITHQDLSFEAGLDIKVLQGVFFLLKGMTIHQYQVYYRLNKIKNDLNQFDLTIESIAKLNGFSAPKYFYFFFKKHTGQTANEFRCGLLRNGYSLPFIDATR